MKKNMEAIIILAKFDFDKEYHEIWILTCDFYAFVSWEELFPEKQFPK